MSTTYDPSALPMVENTLAEMIKDSTALRAALTNNMYIPQWAHYKLAVANDRLHVVTNYLLEEQKKQGERAKQNPATDGQVFQDLMTTLTIFQGVYKEAEAKGVPLSLYISKYDGKSLRQHIINLTTNLAKVIEKNYPAYVEKYKKVEQHIAKTNPGRATINPEKTETVMKDSTKFKIMATLAGAATLYVLYREEKKRNE